MATRLTAQLDLTRRNVAAADWAHGIPALLERARIHLAERIDEEQFLIEVSEGLMVEQAEQGETENSATLARIADRIRAYSAVHMQLWNAVVGANSVFLDAQAYQGFGITLDAAIDFTDAFHQALLMPAGDIADAIDAVRPKVQIPSGPPIVTVGGALDRLLAPPREISVVHESGELDLVDLPDRRMFDADQITGMLRRFAMLPVPTLLSTLLRDDAPKDADLAALLALAESRAATGAASITRAGTDFSGPTHHGDDLVIAPDGRST